MSSDNSELSVSTRAALELTVTVSVNAPTCSAICPRATCSLAVTTTPVSINVLKPACSAFTVYEPGSTAVKLNVPSSLLARDRLSLVASLMMVTLELGRDFPDGSITVPSIVPVVVICAKVGPENKTASSAQRRKWHLGDRRIESPFQTRWVSARLPYPNI